MKLLKRLVLVALAIGMTGSMALAQQEQVGQIAEFVGTATVARAGGSQALGLDAPIYQNDTIETQSGTVLLITFVDGTNLSMSSNAAMTIDEMVYSPGASDNSALFSLTTGLFVLVSGDAARSGDMVVSTPVSTIGIRGTAVAIKAAREEIENTITLLRDPNGNDGLVEVSNELVSAVLQVLGDSVTLTRRDTPKLTVRKMSPAQMAKLFGSALAIMQRHTNSNLGADQATFDDLSADDAADLQLLFLDLFKEASAE